MGNSAAQHILIGISGASGALYGIRLLELLRHTPVTTHLVISRSAQLTIPSETDYTVKQVQALADIHHPAQDIGATIASGSFRTAGMIIAPCSVKTLAEIASGVTASLLTRAADVTLKERRRLVLMVRETPLHSGHLRNMATLSDMGAVIAPPVPAFYQKPESVEDIIHHSIARVLDLFDLPIDPDHVKLKRWQGLKPALSDT